MLDELFTSKSRVKLLELFLLNPKQEFHVRNITRKSGENINSVRRELSNLEKIGLVTSRCEANLKYYTVNMAFPIYKELSSIFIKTRSVGDIIKRDMKALGKIKKLFIYGSFAKGESGPRSDVDLFVVGEVDEHKLVDTTHALEQKLGREVNYTLFTEKEFNKRKESSPFIKNVLNEPKIMLVGE